MEKNISYRTYVLTWLYLLVLTSITVAIAGLNLKGLNILIPLFIASLKSALVINFFMHLKYESMVLKIMLFVTIGMIAILIGFTFFDISFR